MGPEKARERARAEHLKRPFQMLYSGLLTGSSLGPFRSSPRCLGDPKKAPRRPREGPEWAQTASQSGAPETAVSLRPTPSFL